MLTTGRSPLAAAALATALTGVLLAASACGPSGTPGVPDAGPDAPGPSCDFPPGAQMGNLIRLIYLAPIDRPARPEATRSLEAALRHVQLWFRDHAANGKTFVVHEPVVDVVALPHEARWYSTHTTDGDPETRFWDNVVDDAFVAVSASWDDPWTRWLFVVDAEPACGQWGGIAGGSVAVVNGNDLRGLLGEELVPICAGDETDPGPRCRWVGGIAWMVGQATGLSAPAGCSDEDPGTECQEDNIVWAGYASYPDATLTDENHWQIHDSPFFRQVGSALPQCALDCETTFLPQAAP